MAKANNRALIFRLGKIEFFLDLAQVVEVVESADKVLDSTRSDINRGIISALWFRKTWIPVVDPALTLNIDSDADFNDKVAVVLHSSEGNWALLVDSIVKLVAADRLTLCDIPFLLKVSASSFYSQLRLLENRPIVVFEPENYYGSAVVSL